MHCLLVGLRARLALVVQPLAAAWWGVNLCCWLPLLRRVLCPSSLLNSAIPLLDDLCRHLLNAGEASPALFYAGRLECMLLVSSHGVRADLGEGPVLRIQSLQVHGPCFWHTVLCCRRLGCLGIIIISARLLPRTGVRIAALVCRPNQCRIIKAMIVERKVGVLGGIGRQWAVM